MQKPFDALYAKLETSLNSIDRRLPAVDRYAQGIVLIRAAILDMQAAGRKYLAGRGPEVEYFRRVWPLFYAKLFLYIRLHGFELAHFPLAVDNLDTLVAREERKVAAFFRTNREFWMYYRSGSVALDEQFTRAYGRGRIFDPLSAVIDPEGCTLGSYRAALCLAMEAYGAWLDRERQRLRQPGGGSSDYTWAPADADFVEWLYGLYAVGAIQYKGEPADISRLQRWSKWALGKEVVNIYDRFKVLRNRKKERMAFTKRIATALERKMDAAEGKFE